LAGRFSIVFQNHQYGCFWSLQFLAQWSSRASRCLPAQDPESIGRYAHIRPFIVDRLASSTGLHHRPACQHCAGKTEVSGFAQTRRSLAISLCANAAASARSTKVQIFRRYRHSDDRHAGIVLGFSPHLNASFEQRPEGALTGWLEADDLTERKGLE
jgi:hypothetical protein